MKYNLLSIFDKISKANLGEICTPFSSEELLEWTLFDRGNEYLNESLVMHKWSGVPIDGRSVGLDKCLEIEGDYLLLDYIGHQPSIHLRRFESTIDLANQMISSGGIFNVFTTIQIPIIMGQIPDMKALVKFKEDDPDTEKSERIFTDEIQRIFTTLDSTNFESLALKGREYVIKHKERGLTKERAYNILLGIKIIYQTLGLENVEDLVDEVLDYISGYHGNHNLWIWKS